ncbi:alpha/beta hydrolase family protein [Salinimicrobium sp. MT39]|uniref:Alpha/beta hydrolase family protein n=1 Tax=Salinimicrobium profundisediminis TaxID=2994553 RepID=A0A9X3CX47_9FLAO|nr:alpha/beta hydrolase family protein [Salinimicrobium profundisediminis]MCX2837105.1 alpha/beta hydrolase family protein [Salinimicrobium profundisediminis]
MKRIFTLFLLIGSTFVGYSQNYNPPQGVSEFKTMSSKILNTERSYSIYLPKSYSTDTERKYPVLYLLHGLYGSNTDWVERGHVKDVANRLINAEEAVEMIIVMPDAGTDWYGYFNMNGWAYEDYFFKELIPHIEKTYRTIPDKKHRAIAGLSMGGGGSVVYAQKHPDMFSSVYAMSAWLGIEPGGGIQDADEKGKELNRTVLENHAVEFVSNADAETQKELKDIRWFIDCGDDDFLLSINLDYYRAMQKAEIPSELRVRDGGHDWEYWHSALYRALPFVSTGFLR